MHHCQLSNVHFQLIYGMNWPRIFALVRFYTWQMILHPTDSCKFASAKFFKFSELSG